MNLFTSRYTQVIVKAVGQLGGPVTAAVANAWIGLAVGIVGLTLDLIIHWKRETESFRP